MRNLRCQKHGVGASADDDEALQADGADEAPEATGIKSEGDPTATPADPSTAHTAGSDGAAADAKPDVASAALAEPSKEMLGNIVYITDMAWYTSDIDVEQACSKYGPVQNLKFYEDRSNGRSAGTCVVEFGSNAEAKACIEGLNKQQVGDRTVTVTWPGKKVPPFMPKRYAPAQTLLPPAFRWRQWHSYAPCKPQATAWEHTYALCVERVAQTSAGKQQVRSTASATRS